MTKEQLQRECTFGVTMAVTDKLVATGIISQQEREKIKKILLKKHAPLIAGSAEHPKLFT